MFFSKYVDQLTMVVACVVFIFSTALFFSDTSYFFFSLFAALITTGLTVATLIVIRWFIEALK